MLLLTKKGDVELWELESYTLLRRWVGFKPRPNLLHLAHGGARLFVAANERKVWAWEPLAPHPDGTPLELSINQQPGLLRLTAAGLPIPNKETNEESWLRSGNANITTLAVSEDGCWLAAGEYGGHIFAWDLKTGRGAWTANADSLGIKAVAVSSQAGLLLSGGVDTRLKLWDLSTGVLLAQLRGNTGHVLDIALAPDGQRAVTGDGAGTIRVWDLQVGRALPANLGHHDQVNAVAFSPDGRHALSAGADGRLLLWEVASGKLLYDWKTPGQQATAVSFTPYGDYLCGCSGGQVSLWKEGVDIPIGTWQAFAGKFEDQLVSALAAVGERFLVVTSDRYADFTGLWVVENEKVQVLWQSRKFSTNTAAFTPDAHQAALDGDRLHLWQASAPDVHQPIVIPPDQLISADVTAFSADGRWLARGDINGNILVWDLAESKGLEMAPEHTNYVHAAALSADGRYLLSGGWDGVLRFWEVGANRMVASYVWALPLECCALHQDGKSLRAMVGDKQGNVLFFSIL